MCADLFRPCLGAGALIFAIVQKHNRLVSGTNVAGTGLVGRVNDFGHADTGVVELLVGAWVCGAQPRAARVISLRISTPRFPATSNVSYAFCPAKRFFQLPYDISCRTMALPCELAFW